MTNSYSPSTVHEVEKAIQNKQKVVFQMAGFDCFEIDQIKMENGVLMVRYGAGKWYEAAHHLAAIHITFPEGSAALPCPFCGEPAEIDTQQSYRAVSNGRMGSAVAVYCSVCLAGMTLCKEEFRENTTEELRAMVLEQWNFRKAAV